MSESFEVPVWLLLRRCRGLRVAMLGAGKMGGILLQAFLKNNLLGAGADLCHGAACGAGAGAVGAVWR